jgi:glycerol-3-phosphate dehydrogenase
MSLEERNILINKSPDYGTIICRCEGVSRGEIIDAINSPIPVRTIDGIKRRVRPGMGRCQGGFCTPLVMSLLAEEGKMDMLSITKKGGKSRMLAEETKTHIRDGGDEYGHV